MQTGPFHSLCNEIALDTLQDNPFELHFSIAYPEKLGLNDLSTNLIPFHENYYESNKLFWKERAKRLSEIELSSLNTESTFLYQLLSRHINLQQESLAFPYYNNPLSPSGGIHNQLPILLSEYAFRTQKDVKNYLTLLSQIPDYLEGLACYASQQESHGLSLYTGTLKQIQDQCLELFPEAQLKSNSHLLQTSFFTRLQTLRQEDLLSEEEMSVFITQNNQLLIQHIAPAYKALADSIAALSGRSVQAGLSSYPQGQEYYSFLLKSNTGSDRSVEEIRTMLYDRYDTLYNTYSSFTKNTLSLSLTNLGLETPQEMLHHLYAHSQAHFPSLQLSDPDTVQKIQLKTVDHTLANVSAPAFYMTPPLDANEEHTIYINPAAQMDALGLYTTLAHEGFPGHLYQTVYSQNALSQQKAPLLQHLFYYGGFTEGWAVYAELYAYDYVNNLSASQAVTNALLTDRCQRELQLCLCSILDIYIHHDGATLQDTKDLLSTLGLNITSAETLYTAICDSPANYPKYYVGYLEILELKTTAKELWGADYSDYEFHKWLLETGGGDFSSLAWKLSQKTPE